MSDESPARRGCLRVVLWLVGAALGASVAPMLFGGEFLWALGFVVLVFGSSAFVAYGMWIGRDRGEFSAPKARETVRDVGTFELASGELRVADGPPLRDELRLSGLPQGVWRVSCIYRSHGTGAELLCRVELTGGPAVEVPSPARQEICIDSGQCVVVDGGLTTVDVESLDRVDAEPRAGQGTVRLLRDHDALARGIAIVPPYGDGGYEFTISRGSAETRISIEL